MKKITDSLNLNNVYIRSLCYLLIISVPVFTLYDYCSYAISTNGYSGFPLDDSWIHLTFGKNLKEYFSFTYNKSESATAGSTSPLYTFIVAAGFFLTNNEMILSYAIGGLFFVLASLYFFKLTVIEFSNEILLCLLATLVFIFDYNMNFISLSGMETSLFVFLILLGTYSYKKNYYIQLGIISGLIIWTRPDGIAFVAAVFFHYIYCRFFLKRDESLKLFSAKQLLTAFLIFAGISSLYILMNYILSGTFLPNTYYAKMAFYIDDEKRMSFLKNFVWVQYTFGHYSILMWGFIFSLIYFLFDLARRKYNQTSFYLLFIFIFLLIYTIKLPAPNKFGRYQMPLVPFFIIVSLIGFKDFLYLTKYIFKNKFITNALVCIAFLTILYFSFNGYENYKISYAEMCKFTYNRQVAVADWINQNTEKNDVIAVHDVGAVGYYCDRKLVDVAGLITPEFTLLQNEDNFSEILTGYLKKFGVTYTVFFNDNFNVKNQNPVFITPKGEKLDVFEISKFDPARSKILSGKAYRLILDTKKKNIGMKKNNVNQLMESMDKVLEIEPDCAMAYYIKSYGYSLSKNPFGVRFNLEKAIEYQPDYVPALIGLADMDLRNDNFEEAKKYFLKVTAIEPGNKDALNGLKVIDDKEKGL